VDIDEQKLQKAKHNASIYNVQKNIEFIHSDFMDLSLLETLKGKSIDCVLLSPPWFCFGFLMSGEEPTITNANMI
jgi:tRNA1(Val) A37 N6-methylase TrmN6